MDDMPTIVRPFTDDDFIRGFETTEEKCTRLQNENACLKDELSAERQLRYIAEQNAASLRNEKLQLQKQIEELKLNPPKRKRRTKAEMLAAGETYNEFKSDGKRKARPSDAIRSYEDFNAVQQYFLTANRIRDWALWVIGISLGLRVSDLLALKIEDILNPDGSFKDRIMLIEQKTSKANNCLITESVKIAVTKYLDSIKNNYKMTDFFVQK